MDFNRVLAGVGGCPPTSFVSCHITLTEHTLFSLKEEEINVPLQEETQENGEALEEYLWHRSVHKHFKLLRVVYKLGLKVTL